MSLIAWYKLDGDTLDSSGNGNHGTNVGATIDSSGKIGSCYSFGDNKYILTNNMTIPSDMSISVWVYFSGNSAESGFGGLVSNHDHTNTSNISLGLNNTGSIYAAFGYEDDTRGSSLQTTSTLNLNEWSHVSFSYNRLDNECKVYINGVLVHTQILTKNVKITEYPFILGQWAYSFINHYEFTGKLNDVRIYNHVLSAKEVKELSKAKILHYKFDDLQEPTKNCLIDGGISVTSSAYGIHDYYFSETMVEGETYTITLKGKLGEGKTHFGVYNSGGYIGLCTLYPTNQSADGIFTQTVVWKIVSGEQTASNTFLRVYHMLSATTVNSTIEWIQVEKKDHATPFTDTTRDGSVNDSSGYGHHSNLELTTTPQWTSDSKIGNGCYSFNGDTDSIEQVMLPLIGWNSFTVNIWCLFNETNTRDIIISNYNSTNNFGIEKYTSDVLRLYWNGVSDLYSSSSVLPIGEWCMVTVIRDKENSEVKMFVNGVQVYYNVITLTDLTSLDGTLRLGNDYREGTVALDGKLDNVIVYATALSADDIKELYQTRASLDKNYTLSLAQVNEIPINSCPPFSEWTLWGGATLEDGVVSIPDGGGVTSPLIYIGDATNWYFSNEFYSDVVRIGYTEGGFYRGCSYYDIVGDSTTNSSGHTGNGNAGIYPLNTWTRMSWNTVGGDDVRYVIFNISENSTYSSLNFKVRLPMMTINGEITNYKPYNNDVDISNSTQNINLDKYGVYNVDSVNEVGLPIRYLRESMQGSTANTGNHWTEIQMYDDRDVNVALGTTGDLLTDGITTYTPYISRSSGSYVTIDLGSVQIIDYLKIWHYYGDTRDYHGILTEVSSDNVTWTTVFDSDIDGEYTETSAGNTIIIKSNKLTITKDGNLYIKEINEL